ncbi:uncharacterized protein LOC116207878 [Punica granatum]|uniref:Uncharacterized protein LOC116207878 n=1 Tax=Punica granatum TaxID=22663 RepID=A0A6P8DR36_PUNGR|nr:uncharacterized protein LOC116207878 [Punica granatum]
MSGNPSASPNGEQVNFVNNCQRGNQGLYSNSYNPGWHNHHNFSLRNENNALKPPPGFQKQGPTQNVPPQQNQSRMEELTLSYMQKTDTMLQNQQATIRNLEEVLQQMPSYARIMKDLLTKKRKIDGSETVMLTGECYMILQKDLLNLPRKQRDHGSFTVPCTIGNFHFEKVLIDSGASINLMPLSTFRKLGLGECKETHVTLQLADRSVKYPKGIVENVLVKVKFIFSVDFIVLEMEEDKNVPMILGRPFLATGKALIDVEQDAIKKFGDDKSCYTINIIDELIFESVEEKACVDTMESVLRDLDDWSDDDEPEEEYVENVLEIKARYYEELGTSATKPVPYLTQSPAIRSNSF